MSYIFTRSAITWTVYLGGTTELAQFFHWPGAGIVPLVKEKPLLIKPRQVGKTDEHFEVFDFFEASKG